MKSIQNSNEISQLKDKYIRYYEDVPVQKYAAMYIGRTEQTIISWCKNDKEFFNRVQVAKSIWVKKRVLKTRAEFQLERLANDVFKKGSTEELISPIPIINIVKYSKESSKN